MTELKKVFKKKRKHYRKSTQRPWQTIGLWGRRGKGRQNRSNHAKADHSYENSKTGTAEGFAKVSCFENLLGSPTFVDIRNRRLRCVETGHEVVAGDEEAYTQQVERGAGTSGKTKKIQVTNNHRRVKEETGSNDSELWMHKSSSGLESEQESDEENCKVVLSLLQNKEDVNRDWTKYDHYGSATMIMRLKATIQSL
ncbi:hypothetical protein YC2023_117526 [Brassica napus]